MFVTNWISTTKIQKISEITNFFRHYFLSRTEVTTTHQRTGTTFQRVTARLSLTHAQRDGDCQPRLNIATSQPRHSLGMQQILVVPITAIGSLLLVIATATTVA